MDGLDFHPYPVPQSLPFATGYANARDASVSNLPRIYQAFYDGFNGTPQRTIGQQKGGGLPVSLNEMGIQTDATGQPGYAGTEVSANAAGGMVGAVRDRGLPGDLLQADARSCSPATRTSACVNLFHLVDEPNLAGLAERALLGRHRAAPVAKQSAGVVAGLAAADRRQLPGEARCRGSRRRRCSRPATKK